MAKEYAKAFYRSKAWQQCRASYISKVFGICERCNKPGKIVHHKIYITPENISDPNITLNHDNLEYLCATCHQHEHYLIHKPLRDDVMFDVNGNLVKRNVENV